MPRVFVCYRRDDSSSDAGRIHDHLAAHFGKENVFMDVDGILPGQDFADVIGGRIKECDALVAIIGKDWLIRTQNDQRRLDDPDDFVRIELEAALNLSLFVVPVLVGRADLPKRHDLPPSISRLLRFSALEVRHVSFQQDMATLISSIDRFGREKALARQKAEASHLKDTELARQSLPPQTIAEKPPAVETPVQHQIVLPSKQFTQRTRNVSWGGILIVLFFLFGNSYTRTWITARLTPVGQYVGILAPTPATSPTEVLQKSPSSEIARLGTNPLAVNRDPPGTRRFEKQSDGQVVLDSSTNLMWTVNDFLGMEGGYAKYREALNWRDKLNGRSYAGYKDWRIPTVAEYESIYKSAEGAPFPAENRVADEMWAYESDATARGIYPTIRLKDGSEGYKDADRSGASVRLVRGARKNP